MPRQTREQRRETDKRNGLRWAEWLTDAMTATHTDTTTLITRAASQGATFDKTNVSRWRNGLTAPDPDHAVIVAHVLNQDAAEALRAAGHPALADAVEDPHLARIRAAGMSETEMAVLEKEYLAQLAELDARIAQRVARQSTAREGEDEEKDENAL